MVSVRGCKKVAEKTASHSHYSRMWRKRGLESMVARLERIFPVGGSEDVFEKLDS